MKKRQFTCAAAGAVCCALSVVLAASLGGCGAASAANAGDAASVGDVAVTSAAASAATDDLSAYDLEYSKRDLDVSYDAAQATYITLADNASSAETYTHESASGVSISGNDVTITQAGTYVLSGNLTDGCVFVSIDEEEKCQLVLNGVSISNNDGPCIYVMAADKTFITLADGTQNTLADGADYVLNEDEEPTATIFSKDDLTLNGTGALNITGNYRHAVRSKDDLVIAGGTYVINAVEDALNGKDCLKICDGTFDITCGEDALKSSNDSEEGRGFVVIDGGDFTISAGDDAVHAETLMRITAGTVNVLACYEGYEGTVVRIDGGSTNIVASDDGINAASGSSSEGGMPMGGEGRGGAGGPGAGAGAVPGDAGAGASSPSDAGADGAAGGPDGTGAGASTCKVVVTGGTTYVSAGGDGIDSNGSVEVSGGVLIVEGPTSNADSFFDYDSSATITGGTVLMVGSSGMAQSFSSGTQAFAMASASGSAGQTVILQDAQGNQVASFAATKNFQVVLASADGAAEGDMLTVKIGSTETALTASTTATTSGFGAGGGMGGGRGGDRGGDMAAGGDRGGNMASGDPGAGGGMGGGRGGDRGGNRG